jgi:hypothetical protein
MITYDDGTEVQIGDQVDYDGEPSTVDAIIDTAEECEYWGLKETGIMFKNASFGLVFEPVESSTWNAIIFLGRALKS